VPSEVGGAALVEAEVDRTSARLEAGLGEQSLDLRRWQHGESDLAAQPAIVAREQTDEAYERSRQEAVASRDPQERGGIGHRRGAIW